MKRKPSKTCTPYIGLEPQSLSAAETLGPIIDTLGATDAQVIPIFGLAAAGAEANLTILHGDEADLSDAAALGSAAFDEVTPTNDHALQHGEINLRAAGCGRYIRLKNVGDAANAVLLGAVVLLFGQRHSTMPLVATEFSL